MRWRRATDMASASPTGETRAAGDDNRSPQRQLWVSISEWIEAPEERHKTTYHELCRPPSRARAFLDWVTHSWRCRLLIWRRLRRLAKPAQRVAIFVSHSASCG